jgi:hypothetical protein
MRYLKVSKTPVLNIFAGLMTLLVLTACTAHYTVNSKIETVKSVERYSLRNTAGSEKSDALLLILTFSGGGTRAAALSYGILQALADTHQTWPLNILMKSFLKEKPSVIFRSPGCR